jgi:hypothetical protein
MFTISTAANPLHNHRQSHESLPVSITGFHRDTPPRVHVGDAFTHTEQPAVSSRHVGSLHRRLVGPVPAPIQARTPKNVASGATTMSSEKSASFCTTQRLCARFLPQPQLVLVSPSIYYTSAHRRPRRMSRPGRRTAPRAPGCPTSSPRPFPLELDRLGNFGYSLGDRAYPLLSWYCIPTKFAYDHIQNGGFFLPPIS